MTRQLPPSATATSGRRFDAMWWARRGVIVLVLLVALDVTIEATLATMRRRDVVLGITIVDPSATPAPTVPAGVQPPTATPLPSVLQLKPTDRLSVAVHWNYHIGPRFPTTVVHAEATIDGRSVAEGQVSIDCGTAVIDCTGDAPIALAYTIPATNGSAAQTIDWPTGTYILTVDRSDGGLNPVSLKSYTFEVVAP